MTTMAHASLPQSLGPPAGFTYLGVLLLVAAMGALLASTGEIWRTVRQREAERELRFIGEEFRRAIGRYYESTPGPVKKFPPTLADLLEDDRFPETRRYLRRIYRDPLTLRPEWGLIKAPDDGIAGIYSLSTDEPLGRLVPDAGTTEAGRAGSVIHTPAQDSAEDGAPPGYSGWTFVYSPPPAPPPRPAVPPAPGGRAAPGSFPPSRPNQGVLP